MSTRRAAVASTYCRERHEWNLILRAPFWLNLRVGRTQNALWFGRRDAATIHTVFNRLARDARLT